MNPGARILIIDDEPPIRSACAKILAAEGAFCETAEDGLAGLEKARSGNFDLALIDLKMPQMGGMELLSRLTELDPDLVKIVITGYATLETAIEAVQKGAYDYIPKPFTPGELRTRVAPGSRKKSPDARGPAPGRGTGKKPPGACQRKEPDADDHPMHGRRSFGYQPGPAGGFLESRRPAALADQKESGRGGGAAAGGPPSPISGFSGRSHGPAGRPADGFPGTPSRVPPGADADGELRPGEG